MATNAWVIRGTGLALLLAASHTVCQSAGQSLPAQTRVIEILADKDSRYKIPGEHKPEIRVKAGEQVVLRITARKAKTWNRDGSIHGFTLLRAKDRTKVPDWNLLLRPGTQEFLLTAPAEPGEYVVVCTVICSENHEGMNMKFVVVQ
jgi:heme/copper-type cytochrome/quinol oxidase subunit 2